MTVSTHHTPATAEQIGATVASVLVDSARAENDYLKITHQDHSPFMEPVDEGLQRLENKGEPTAHNPFPRVVRHTLEG